MNYKTKSKKIFLLYTLIALAFLIFLSVLLLTVLNDRHIPSLYTQETSKSQRGSIISADGFHIATTQKLYKAVVNTLYIDPQKMNLFVELFSIYSGIEKNKIINKIKNAKGPVVLSYNITEKIAQYLKSLSYELRRYNVFVKRKNPKTGYTILHGLNIIESGESREYPYGDLLTPIIGYPHKQEEDGYTYIKGVKGLEKRFERALSPRQDELRQGKRDVNRYIILNKQSFSRPHINGLNIQLNIPVGLQIRVEKMLDAMKVQLKAKEIICAVMDTKSAKVVTLASSNRYLPKSIKRSDYPSLNSAITEYSFEPGSVMKPITFALLLDNGLVNPYDLVNCHNGRFKIGKKVITDEHDFGWLSAENVIVRSSNIGIAKLAQKLSGVEFHEGLLDFGFAKKSTPDLVYEKRGSIPSAKQLNNEIYKVASSYGYGMRVNLMQLLRSYSVFNNNGRIVTPKIVSSFIDERGRVIKIPNEEQIQVIKSSTADRIKKILIKTVNEGTAKKAKTKGLIVGGKTGTAHIVERGQYVNRYNNSFLGFANDREKTYTMSVCT